MKRLALIRSCISNNPVSFDSLQTLIVNKENSVATVWLNSLKNLNAISLRMIQELKFVLPALDKDHSIKVILIRSKHPKYFSVGADIKSLLINYHQDRDSANKILQTGKTIKSVRKPLISVVEGAALGGGFEICLLSDIILCSENASFSLPEIKLGLFPGMGGTQILPRIIGTKLATKYILSGDTITAAEAGRLNIAHVYPADKFEQKVSQYLNILVNKPLDSLQAAKKAVKVALETTLDQGLQYEASIFQGLFNKAGPKEGLSAFVEKRKPNFRNI